MKDPAFLTLEDILAIHAHQVARFGGAPGLRDRGLVASAVAQTHASFGGTLVHSDVFEMAAAYAFRLVLNHGFIDGNKRVGLAAALVFLEINGVPIERGTEALYTLTVAIARGEVDKQAIAERLRELAF